MCHLRTACDFPTVANAGTSRLSPLIQLTPVTNRQWPIIGKSVRLLNSLQSTPQCKSKALFFFTYTIIDRKLPLISQFLNEHCPRPPLFMWLAVFFTVTTQRGFAFDSHCSEVEGIALPGQRWGNSSCWRPIPSCRMEKTNDDDNDKNDVAVDDDDDDHDDDDGGGGGSAGDGGGNFQGKKKIV
ncbi:hypothetical protein PoB_005245200 [Plakobranchus ocellatus]|uniref:Uncharacterized protein n=1 Tax=Plakobranchus ocellatus TaxID=259542 RepID=A0AAV4C2V8_9GAST|nr:hypothetical protein PoB_005245200 [Plakobranchus ocellatus]